MPPSAWEKKVRKVSVQGMMGGNIWNPKKGKFSSRLIKPLPHGANP
jgi:hypothetical protein